MKKIRPSHIRRKIRSSIFSKLGGTLEEQLTIAQEWEQYAQRYKGKKGEHLGNEWNDPDKMGINASVSVDQIVPYLDEKIFTPFIGWQDNANIDYKLLDGQGLTTISDESVDAAFAYGVFVHIQHWDIFNYLSELNRVLKPGGKVILHHANTFSELGWKLFLINVSESVNKPKPYWTFTVMTPELIRELTERSGLILEDCITDIVRRDCISLIKKPKP